MKIVRGWAHNIAGFVDFELDFGDVNVFRGSNGSGKTSALSIVTGMLGGGTPRMLRAGTASGELGWRISSDDGFETWDVIRCFDTERANKPSVTSSLSGPIGAPVDFLERIIDSVSMTPIARLMQASEKEQAKLLLETIPIKVDVAEIEAAVGCVDVPGLTAHMKNAANLSGFDALAAVGKCIYDHRRDTNRDAKNKAINASQLLQGIPQGAGDILNWKERESQLQSDLDHERSAESKERLGIEQETSGMSKDAQKWEADQLAIINREIDDQIKALEVERSTRKEGLQLLVKDKEREIAEYKSASLDKVTFDHRSEIERLAAELATAKKNSTDQVTHDRTREIARKAQDESAVLAKRSELMTASLQRLDKVRADLLGRLPIKGLSMQDGVIYLENAAGKPLALSQWNTAEQVKFWLRIGAMRASEMALGICVVDGAECMDPATMRKVLPALVGSGLQWFIGRVEGEPDENGNPVFDIEVISAETVSGSNVTAGQ